MKLVSLQKGVNSERFECNILRKVDLTSDIKEDTEDKNDVSENRDDSDTHTLEELKQINNQLYKYSLKHVLKSGK